MPNNLTQLLKELKNNPTVVIQLYQVLYNAEFIVLIRPGTEDKIDTMEFLSYPTEDGIKELPIFTEEEFVIVFSSIQPTLKKIKGPILWPRLLEIIETGILEVAIDPSQSHGIRLNNSMVRGMISAYS